MEKIRPYQEKDFDRVRKICLENAGDTRTEEQKIFILSTYCDYYIEQEPENCFVAVNENDEAVGYIFVRKTSIFLKIGLKRFICLELKPWAQISGKIPWSLTNCMKSTRAFIPPTCTLMLTPPTNAAAWAGDFRTASLTT